MKTTKFINKENADIKWYHVDANGQVLGKLCSNIAKIIRGKNKPTYSPNADTGDFVVVTNADKIKITGAKSNTKYYQNYSGYYGGLKETKFSKVLEKYPERIIIHAVKGMLPHNKLGNKLIDKLKVYSGDKHPHNAQKPETIEITKEKHK